MSARIRAAVLAAAAATALSLSFAGTAQAAAPAADYGEHVHHCAQTMGFTGEHNPGMHHGNAGWDGMACPPQS